MSNIKRALEQITNCENCNGQGITGWVAPDGDYDFEYCECNSLNLILDEDGNVI